jgi:hypothetical protein
MPGTISQTLLSNVRGLLNDRDRKLISEDGTIYSRLTTGQEFFMNVLKTSRKIFKIALVPNTFSYSVDERMFHILRILYYKSDAEIDKNKLKELTDYFKYEIIYDMIETGDSRHVEITDSFQKVKSIKFDEESVFTSGDYIALEGYCGPKSTDIIDESTDPIIEKIYYNYLVDYVCADYANEQDKRKRLKTLDQVLKSVKLLRDSLQKPEGHKIFFDISLGPRYQF